MNKIVGKSCYKPPNCVEVNNTIVSDEQKIADYFNTYFSSIPKKLTEVESSRTHFEVLGLEGQVLGLGLEASSPQKLACPRLEDISIF